MGSPSTDKPIHFLRFLRWKHLLESFAQELLCGSFGDLQNIFHQLMMCGATILRAQGCIFGLQLWQVRSDGLAHILWLRFIASATCHASRCTCRKLKLPNMSRRNANCRPSMQQACRQPSSTPSHATGTMHSSTRNLLLMENMLHQIGAEIQKHKTNNP